MTRNRPDYNFLAIAFGGIVFVLGLTLVSGAAPEADREGPVYCGDREMRPGGVCTTFGRGVETSSRDYGTMAVEQLQGHGWVVWLLCLGVLTSLGAALVTGLYIHYVRSLAGRNS
ncbi:hypothetical protein CFN78_08340 [Amycolatopsis antarctica]|uniref:Uncharacterized protein n=1 Tax=Amycolatopsis antarctica TaxID=1854586 RepID=A0A263D508_9PSEU|nr:hypothetical protein [Amycolatopsis antarctica]OZM73540.1 hypothetical protein CFN78_08340 [Amycolatopsis antarctica]